MMLATSNIQHLAKKLKSKQLRYHVGNYTGGEFYYRLLYVKKPSAVTLMGNITADPQSLFELLALAQAAKDAGIVISRVIVPYLAYSRQDKKKEVMLPEMIGNVLKTIPTKQFVFVDVHSDRVRGVLPKHEEIQVLPYLLQQVGLEADLIIAPDRGAVARAKSVAKGGKIIVMNKTRLGPQRILRERHKFEVRGKSLLMVDDIIDSGRTIVSAAAMLKKQGAKSITVLATHGVFSTPRAALLKNSAIDAIYTSNTLPGKNTISIAPCF